MADQLIPPSLVQPIPSQIINEGAAFGPLNLNDFIQCSDIASGKIYFFAELEDGTALPKGLICTGDGIINGIPAAGTHGVYTVRIVAENDSGVPCVAEFSFTIKERMTVETQAEANILGVNFKSKVWEALKENLPIPELSNILNREISAVEIYYLLQRFATLTIWDVYNLDAPSEKKLLDIKGLNKHYVIYDRGSCMVAAPKDLFSHERTLEDALQAARLLSQEVYNRGWVIEFAGFDKMVRASWVELQLLGDKHAKVLEILHYVPTTDDLRAYQSKSHMVPTGPIL
jgi:hypothetical protein